PVLVLRLPGAPERVGILHPFMKKHVSRSRTLAKVAFFSAMISASAWCAPAPKPVITRQPIPSDTVLTGSGIMLSVSATSRSHLRYNWQKDCVSIGAPDTSTLTLTNLQPADSGRYRVVVGNGAHAAVSEETSLTVLPASDRKS